MALAVRPDMRKYKMGTKIIEESIKMAREAGAEYYKGKKRNLLDPAKKRLLLDENKFLYFRNDIFLQKMYS